jgi:hypothetical protein
MRKLIDVYNGEIVDIDRDSNYGLIRAIKNKLVTEFIFFPDDTPNARKGDRVSFIKDSEYKDMDVATSVQTKLSMAKRAA